MMKYLLIFSLLCLTLACKKQEVPTYTGAPGISFYIDKFEPDSLSYSFAFSVNPKLRDTVFLKMRAVGAAADHDRLIKVKAGVGTTARQGLDYELPEIMLPAGALTVRYPVVFLNSPEMLSTTFRLVVEVAKSKDLEPGATGTEIAESISLKEMKIDVSNQLLKPSYWADMESAFGDFSVVKFKFMIQVTGLTDFSYEALGLDGYYNLPVKLRNALEQYELNNGPLMDEFGNPVTF